MVKIILRFPSDEWIKTFKDELNKNIVYQKVAKDWEGDFLFVVTPDQELKQEIIFYIDLWHGKCREAYLVSGKKKAKFVFKGPYSNWKKVIQKELDPIRGLIRGMFSLDGDSRVILDQAKAAQELVNTASNIPVIFKKE
jgi:putative sterol carrier protein